MDEEVTTFMEMGKLGKALFAVLHGGIVYQNRAHIHLNGPDIHILFIEYQDFVIIKDNRSSNRAGAFLV